MDEDLVPELPAALRKDISTISGIEAVPNILQVVCHATGMGFAAVARVTEGALDRLLGARSN
jgi:hypothetical protein